MVGVGSLTEVRAEARMPKSKSRKLKTPNGGTAASVDTVASDVVQLSDNIQPTTIAAPATPTGLT